MGHGIQQFPLENTLSDKCRRICVQKLVFQATKVTTVWATAATEMFQLGAPEKLIQERTGHRSLEALRSYERLNEDQHRVASAILARKPEKVQYTNNVRMQSSMSNAYTSSLPAFNVHEMHGCVINNYYSAPPQATVYNDTTYSAEDINQLSAMQEL